MTTSKPTEFDRVLRLLRLGLERADQQYQYLLFINAQETAAEALVQLEADRLLVKGWEVAAEYVAEEAEPVFGVVPTEKTKADLRRLLTYCPYR